MATTQEQLLKQAMSEITEGLTANLRDMLIGALEKQISESLAKSLLESAFYRRISKDMQKGLKRIYKEISTVAAQEGEQADKQPGELQVEVSPEKLVHEASKQLDAVLATTEEATVRIMELVEKTLDSQDEVSALIGKIQGGSAQPDDVARLGELNAALGADLTSIMTALSFQDLTGQRIKKVVTALKQIEETVVEMYLSTGLLIKAREEKPEADLDAIQKQAEDVVADFKTTGAVAASELKGPSASGISQSSIDDLLSQLGSD